ncbi:hypothetical protein FB45DRAFT_890522 [Roridomyces roridus]|uniref:Uncharacterized protein n=1 Tax=Roridomyces roridus TaxID=1738132 RepID=A0AAD7FZM0_9AGAR|nr:hypothetical protein FB45DRAFT_890522 [Roridomyces roridus]
MADPISITTTFITLATFIKDLVDLGLSIKHSIEKVGENRKRVQVLTDDILRTLANLSGLLDGPETRTFQAPHLLKALGDLKADMLHVLSVVCAVAPPAQGAAIRRISSHMKCWFKRDVIEREIQNLQAHVNKCFVQFTALSGARGEYTALRVEQALLVNTVENDVKLRRLEKLMAHLLLNTEFGTTVVHRTANVISVDSKHETLESQYLSTQTMRLVDTLETLLPSISDSINSSDGLWDETEPMEIQFIQPETPLRVLHSVLSMLLETGNPAPFSRRELADELITLGSYLSSVGMHAEGMASDILVVKFIRNLAAGEHFVGVIPRLAFALSTLSKQFRRQCRYDLAVKASQQSRDLCHLLAELSPGMDHRPILLSVLVTHAKNLAAAWRIHEAIKTARRAALLCRPIVTEILALPSSQPLSSENEWRAARSCDAFFAYASALSASGRHHDAHMASKEALQIVVKFSGSIRPPSRKNIERIFTQLCKLTEAGMLSLSIITDVVNLYGKISQIYQEEYSLRFLPVLYAHAQACSPDSDHQAPLQVRLEPAAKLMEEALRAFYAPQTLPNETSGSTQLIHYFFTKHFGKAHSVLCQIVRSLISQPTDAGRLAVAVARVSDTISSVSPPQQILLLEILTELVAHFRGLFSFRERDLFLQSLWWYCWALWLPGRLKEALAIIQEATTFVQSTPGVDAQLDEWLFDHALILFDMGRIQEADDLLASLTSIDGDAGDPGYSNTFLRTQILQRTGRYQEALCLLEKADEADDISHEILQADIGTVYLALGKPHRAIECAEKLVSGTRTRLSGATTEEESEDAKSVLAYALTTLSTCLASAGRDDEGLFLAQEAVDLALSLEWPLDDWPAIFRSQELIARALHTLSLRLRLGAGTSGLEDALEHAEHASDMYRDLVSLAPRHLPALASSLMNSSRILWDQGQFKDSIAAAEEAICILRQVAQHERYLVRCLREALEELAERLTAVGDDDGASRVCLEITVTTTSQTSATDTLGATVELDSVELDITPSNRWKIQLVLELLALVVLLASVFVSSSSA